MYKGLATVARECMLLKNMAFDGSKHRVRYKSRMGYVTFFDYPTLMHGTWKPVFGYIDKWHGDFYICRSVFTFKMAMLIYRSLTKHLKKKKIR